ncbi:hypothetical protein AX16_005777 [Volvariella volvacea WC 439]|nr:hypothetical protein AX16_005777 [Volvariella volvacea WC 439]
MAQQLPQALHPSIIPRLDPEYVEFHNKHITHLPPLHELKWDPAVRNATGIIPGLAEPEEVGSIADFELSQCKVRVYTPKGERPEGGWPCFLFFHGGGWTLGNIASEARFCTCMCNNAKTVVVSVDYRLAPEIPYPAAVEDAVESLHWVYNQGPSLININPSKIAVGGSSSGGNLAAILALKSAELSPPIPIIFQLLVVPVTDNTALPNDPKTALAYPSWTENVHTPWLSPARMLWFRSNYLPGPNDSPDKTKWDASPIFAGEDLLRRLSETSKGAWIGVCELDLLRDEGIRYGERLKSVGVEVETVVYKGAPHPIMALADWIRALFGIGVLSIGTRLVNDAGQALAKAFGTA